jgi:hypothetical protein
LTNLKIKVLTLMNPDTLNTNQLCCVILIIKKVNNMKNSNICQTTKNRLHLKYLVQFFIILMIFNTTTLIACGANISSVGGRG